MLYVESRPLMKAQNPAVGRPRPERAAASLLDYAIARNDAVVDDLREIVRQHADIEVWQWNHGVYLFPRNRERFVSTPIAKMLFIEKNLLKNQLSANLWRTLGTAVALTIGLGVYSFLEISGYSMLVPYTHSERLPNTLVACMPKGLPLDRIDTVRNLDGVDRDKFLPIALEQPLFSSPTGPKDSNDEM